MKVRSPTEGRDGHQDGLLPLAPLDVAACPTVDDLVRAMGRASFGARRLSKAADTLEAMFTDPDCGVVLTLSGAMTPAKMGLLVCEMVERGWVDVVVSTGALIAHGFVEGVGDTHFAYDPDRHDDAALYAAGYDRIYDTLELERNLHHVGRITDGVFNAMDEGHRYSSAEMHRLLGAMTGALYPGSRGILQACHQHDVPIYVPAFSDSEIGLTAAIWGRYCRATGADPPFYDAIADVDAFTDWCGQQEKLGIFTIGGGVPRNWAQQVGPYVEWLAASEVPVEPRPKQASCRYTYGVRICPEPTHVGGLSGCTYSEGISWGKFVPASEGGRYAEVYADATIVWPILVRALIERLGGP